MKRLAVTISLSLVVVLTLSFLYVSRVAATKVTPSVQMLSTSYTGAMLSLFPAFTTVETLSFSVAAPAKLEVTSENESVGNPAACQIALDGAVIVADTVAPSSSPDLTVTDTSVAAGSHTLTVQCVATALPATASGTVSAIITTGL